MAPGSKIAVGQVIQDLITQSLKPLEDEFLKYVENRTRVDSKQTENQKYVESLVKDLSQNQAESSRHSAQIEEKLNKALVIVDALRKNHEQVLEELRDTKQQLKALELLVKESQNQASRPSLQQPAVDGPVATAERDDGASADLNHTTDASRWSSSPAIVPQKRSYPEANHEDVSGEDVAADTQAGADAGRDAPATSETPMQPPATAPCINRSITNVLQEERLLTSPSSPGTLRATSPASSPTSRNHHVEKDGDAPMIDVETSAEDQSIITVTTEEKTMWRASWYGAGKPGTLEDFVRERKKELNANNRGRETRKASRASSLMAKPPSSQSTPKNNRPSTAQNENMTSSAPASKRARTTAANKKDATKPATTTDRPSTSSSSNQGEQPRRGARQKRVPAHIASGDFVPSANIFDDVAAHLMKDSSDKPTTKARTAFQPVNGPVKSSQAAKNDRENAESSSSDAEIPTAKPASRPKPQAAKKTGDNTTKPKKAIPRKSAPDKSAEEPRRKATVARKSVPSEAVAKQADSPRDNAQPTDEQAATTSPSSAAQTGTNGTISQRPAAARVEDMLQEAARSSYVAQEENVNVMPTKPVPKATSGSRTSLPSLLSMFNPRTQKE